MPDEVKSLDKVAEGTAEKETSQETTVAGISPQDEQRKRITDELVAEKEAASAPLSESSDDTEKADGEAEKETVIEEVVDDTETEDPIESLLKETSEDDKKSNVQKRIDRLIAEKKALEERLQTLETKVSEPKEGETKYTKAQLASAMKKAMEDGDHELVMEIMDYRINEAKSSLKKEYESEQKAKIEAAKQQQSEWLSIQSKYSYLSDAKQPEIYDGSHKELNILDGGSLLYQLALKLYGTEDEELSKKYRRAGGQELAVADALTLLLSKRRGMAPKDKEKTLLQQQLAKSKRKTSLGGGSPGQEEKPVSKPKTAKEVLDDVIAERKLQKEKFMSPTPVR